MTPLAANALAGYAGLAIFIGFFAVVVIKLLRKGARETADQHAQIPFKED